MKGAVANLREGGAKRAKEAIPPFGREKIEFFTFESNLIPKSLETIRFPNETSKFENQTSRNVLFIA